MESERRRGRLWNEKWPKIQIYADSERVENDSGGQSWTWKEKDQKMTKEVICRAGVVRVGYTCAQRGFFGKTPSIPQRGSETNESANTNQTKRLGLLTSARLCYWPLQFQHDGQLNHGHHHRNRDCSCSKSTDSHLIMVSQKLLTLNIQSIRNGDQC